MRCCTGSITATMCFFRGKMLFGFAFYFNVRGQILGLLESTLFLCVQAGGQMEEQADSQSVSNHIEPGIYQMGSACSFILAQSGLATLTSPKACL